MLTDEKIKEIAEKFAKPIGFASKGQYERTVHASVMAIREALAEDGWVKVTPETMPPIGEKFLIWFEGKFWQASRQDVDCWLPCEIKHWHPLPAPPTKETKDV